jgi:hypothetical protein
MSMQQLNFTKIPETSKTSFTTGRSGLLQRKSDRTSAFSPFSAETVSDCGRGALTPHQPRFSFDFSRVPVQADSPAPKLQRMPANAAPLSIGAPDDRYEQEAEQVAEQVLRMPLPAMGVQPSPAQGALPPMNLVQRACDRATTHVNDAPAIIEQARADAVQYVNAAIPVVMHGLHERPDSWFGMIAGELLDRHFHCPGQEDLEDILTTLQEVLTRLPTVNLDCLGSDRQCNPRRTSHFTHRGDLSAGLLCPAFFHDSQPVQAGELIALVARLLPQPLECSRLDSCYNDFARFGHSLMIHNAYSYGYFSTAAAGHELVPEPPGGVTCRPPEPGQQAPNQSSSSYPPLPSSTQLAFCYAQGTATGRQVVISQSSKQAHVLTASSAVDGEIYEERIDRHGQRFVCDHGRRIDQRW